MNNDKKALVLFLVIVFSLSAIIETLWIIYGENATNTGISSLLMFIPFIAALIVSIKYYKKQNGLGFKRCNPIYLFLAKVFPLIYLGISYCLYWLFCRNSYVGNLSVLIEYASVYNKNISNNSAIIISLIITFIVTIITAIGEEVGWRGFMYPVMQRICGCKKAIIISGGIWALWHLPLLISGLYLSETIMVYRIPVFIIEVFALTVIITWIRMKSKSVWPAIFFHAVHNYLDQIIFQSLTNNVKSTYFVGETGFITIIFTVITTVLIIIREKNVFLQNKNIV